MERMRTLLCDTDSRAPFAEAGGATCRRGGLSVRGALAEDESSSCATQEAK
jgi:hypothetical protein